MVHQFVDDYISKRETSQLHQDTCQRSSESFVDQLAEESGSHELLRDQLLNVLLAGHCECSHHPLQCRNLPLTIRVSAMSDAFVSATVE